MGRSLGRVAGPAFFRGETVAVARRLLGSLLVHDTPEGRTVGRVVETEAYLADDPAAHSFAGPTDRNRSMFERRGHAYVYRIYGMHLCFNVVTGPAGVGEAVLVRALEPLENLELMAIRRGLPHAVGPRELCSGPGKLAQAMGIRAAHDGSDLSRGDLRLHVGRRPAAAVVASPRIGISKAAERPLRFVPAGCGWTSRRADARAR